MYLSDLSQMVDQTTARQVEIVNPFLVSSTDGNTECFTYSLLSCTDCSITVKDSTESMLQASFWMNDLSKIGSTESLTLMVTNKLDLPQTM